MNSSSSTLTLGCIGDLIITEGAKPGQRQLDINALKKQFTEPLKSLDIILANLEAPVTSSKRIRENKRYNFKSGTWILKLLDKRFILSLANNHILDYGERGLQETIEALDAHAILHAGAGRNLDEARRPAIVELPKFTLGVLCAADPRFNAAGKTSPGTFPALGKLVQESIIELKNSADLIAVSIHTGTELIPAPSPNQLNIAELCLNAGAFVVSFHHSHRVSGIFQDQRGVVCYGTGDFVRRFSPATAYPRLEKTPSGVFTISTNLRQRRARRVEYQPLLLDKTGFPRKAAGYKNNRLKNMVKEYSYRISRKKSLFWWRVSGFAKPLYIYSCLINYADIIKRRGIHHWLKTLSEAYRLQFK